MSAKRAQLTGWKVEATDPPKLSDMQWGVASLLGVLLIVMAILQLVSFTDYKDTLSTMGLSGPTAWGIIIILAELWGAAVFFKLRLSHLFRQVSAGLALLVAAFWFVENLQLISGGAAGLLPDSDFFGRFLKQSPGWWTAIEVSILLFWTLYVLSLSKDALRNK